MNRQKILSDKLSQFKFIEAVGLATAIGLEDETKKDDMQSLVEYLYGYHRRLMDFSPYRFIGHDISRNVQENEIIKNSTEFIIKTEQIRINQIFINAKFDKRTTILVLFFIAYYSLINQDGFRTSYWLGKALSESVRLNLVTIEKYEILSTSLVNFAFSPFVENADINCENLKIELNTHFSMYTTFQEITTLFSNTFKCDFLDEISIFSPTINISNHGFFN